MKTLKELLIELNACEDAIKWVGNKTIEQAVPECHRGDWMLWLAAQVNYDHRLLTLAKGHCANTVRHLMKDPRSIKAVDTAIAYGEGNATWQELKDAADLADAAVDAASAAYAAVDFDRADIAAAASAAAASAAYTAVDFAAADLAAYASYVAAYAADLAAYASYVDAYAADLAADFAAYTAVDFAAASFAAYAARKENRMQTADICRKYIGKEIIEKVNELLNG